MDFPGPLREPQGAGGPVGLGGLETFVFGGPDDQGVGTAFGGGAGFGKVGGPGFEAVGKGCCDCIIEEGKEEDEEVGGALVSEAGNGSCELATTAAAAAGNAWLITSAANSSGVEGFRLWI